MSRSNDHDEPVPLVDDPLGDPLLKELFAAARQDVPVVNVPRIAAVAAAPIFSWAKLLGWLLAITSAVTLTVALSNLGRSPDIGTVAEKAPDEKLVAARPARSAGAITSESPADAALVAPSEAVRSGAVAPGVTLGASGTEAHRTRTRPPSGASNAGPASVESAELEEGMMLLRARRALGEGDEARALSAVREHESRFPNGRLAEEREAIAIDALIAGGAIESSRTRARRFLQRWPTSAYAARARRAVRGATAPRQVGVE